MLIDVIIVFAQEHGHEFNGDQALQELYDYVRRYQDQVKQHTSYLVFACWFVIVNRKCLG